MRKTEVNGIVKILESSAEYESAEDAAKAIIEWLDKDRMKRKSYVAVMQMSRGVPWYIGLGPYPGEASARKAAEKHPAAGMAYKVAVVPMTGPEAFEKWMRELDVYEKGETA